MMSSLPRFIRVVLTWTLSFKFFEGTAEAVSDITDHGGNFSDDKGREGYKQLGKRLQEWEVNKDDTNNQSLIDRFALISFNVKHSVDWEERERIHIFVPNSRRV